jgi:hypothetical protein
LVIKPLTLRVKLGAMVLTVPQAPTVLMVQMELMG